MKKLIFIINLLLFVTLIFGCCSNNKIYEALQTMKSHSVNMPFCKLSCWINDTIQINRPWENAKMKLIVYTDSSSCSECTLKRMYLWNDFVELEKKYKNEFYIFFVFQTKPKINTKKFASAFHFIELNHPVYVDSLSIFSGNNPHIPFQDPIFQIFLLDENNEVVLVGNPLFNTKVEDSLLKILEDKLNKP